MLLFFALVLSFVGTWLLNQQGRLTANKAFAVYGLVLNLIALVIFADIYGTARGSFVYLAAWALVGMAIAFIQSYRLEAK